MTFGKAKRSAVIRIALWVLLDVALCNCAMILAQQFRFEAQIPEEFFRRYLSLAPTMYDLFGGSSAALEGGAP